MARWQEDVGLIQETFQTVTLGVSNTENATNFLSVYSAAKVSTPNGLALSPTNRVVILLPAGTYDFAATPLAIDTPYIDFVGLGSTAADTVLDSQVSLANTGTMRQTVQDVHFTNLKIHINKATALPSPATLRTRTSAYSPDSFPITCGDTYHTLANCNEIHVPVGSYDSESGSIFAQITQNVDESWKVTFFKDPDLALQIAHTGRFTQGGRQYLIEDNSSDVYGFVHIVNFTAALTGEHGTNAIHAHDVEAGESIQIKVTGRGKFTNVIFSTSNEANAWSMRLSVEYSQDFINCVAGNYGFGCHGTDTTAPDGTSGGSHWHNTAGDCGFGGNVAHTVYGRADGTYNYDAGGDNSFGVEANGTFHHVDSGEWGIGVLTQGVVLWSTAGDYGIGGEHGLNGALCLYSTAGSGSFGDDCVQFSVCIGCTATESGWVSCSTDTDSILVHSTLLDCVSPNGFGTPPAIQTTGTRLIGCTRTIQYSFTTGALPFVVDCDFTSTQEGISAITVSDGAIVAGNTLISNGGNAIGVADGETGTIAIYDAGNTLTGGVASNVSTTASRAQAVQLSTDQAAVSAKKSYIYPNAEILGINDGTLRASNIGTLAGTDSLQANQLLAGVVVDDVTGTAPNVDPSELAESVLDSEITVGGPTLRELIVSVSTDAAAAKVSAAAIDARLPAEPPAKSDVSINVSVSVE